jgi:hypothetical protein
MRFIIKERLSEGRMGYVEPRQKSGKIDYG